MDQKGETLGACTGPLTIIVFGIGWILLAGWLPPPSPDLSANAVADIYHQNLFGIRTGMIFIQFAGGLNVAFAAIVMVYMKRMKGPSPFLAYAQFGSGVVNSLLYIIPAQIWTTVAYRTERLPDITQFGNDMGWMLFEMVISPAIVQWSALGLAILWDKSPRPVFPRWFAYFNFWSALMMFPASLITYFKAGPFSWVGVLGFYLVAGVFSLWYFVAFVTLTKSIKESSQSDSA